MGVKRRGFEVQIARTLNVKSRLRERSTGALWEVRQMHRMDCLAELELVLPSVPGRGPSRTVSFDQIRKEYVGV